MWWRCNGPKCSCQQAPAKPRPKPLELVLYGTESGQLRQLHGQHTELDVTFDIITGTMILKQKVRNPQHWPRAQHKACVYLNQTNSIFVNLKCLADNSLLFTFKIPSSAGAAQVANGFQLQTGHDPDIWLRTWHQDRGFIPGDLDEGPLFTNLLDCPWREKYMQLLLPENRIKGWKTAALILLTFRKITPTIWHRIVSNGALPNIAGLDWARVEKRAKEEPRRRITFQTAKVKVKAKKLMIDDEISRFGMHKDFGSHGFTRLSDMLSPQPNGVEQADLINGV